MTSPRPTGPCLACTHVDGRAWCGGRGDGPCADGGRPGRSWPAPVVEPRHGAPIADYLPDPQLEQVPDVVVRWDDDTRALIGALYGEAFLEQLEADATAYARAQYAAGEQTPGPGAPPADTDRGEDEPSNVDAGGPGRASPEAAS